MSDAEALFRIFGDPRTQIFNPAGPHPDIELTRQFIEQRIINRRKNGYDDWAIIEKVNPDHIIGFGGVFASQFNGKLTNNLGYRFEPDAWRKGYATELSRKALHYGFEVTENRRHYQRKSPSFKKSARESRDEIC